MSMHCAGVFRPAIAGPGALVAMSWTGTAGRAVPSHQPRRQQPQQPVRRTRPAVFGGRARRRRAGDPLPQRGRGEPVRDQPAQAARPTAQTPARQPARPGRGARRRAAHQLELHRPGHQRKRGDAEPLRLDSRDLATPVNTASVRLLLEFHPDRRAAARRARRSSCCTSSRPTAGAIRNLAPRSSPLGGIRGSAQLLQRELDDPQLREPPTSSSPRPTFACRT